MSPPPHEHSFIDFVIAEPFGGKKSEPFAFAHEGANKGKKSDEKFYTTYEKR
jgi:hypothetical protein